ncbi:hypothetical protein BGZ83_009360 [Gryganskiella cystojenkinii]|nr:hypothetical protein BGZ83_009360 [Gryganskiella cystojenkinii]
MARNDTARLLTFFLVLLVVVTILVSVSEAVTIPIWCYCGYASKTQWACTVSTGNWDGGSCGCDTYAIYSNFKNLCMENPSETTTVHSDESRLLNDRHSASNDSNPSEIFEANPGSSKSTEIAAPATRSIEKNIVLPEEILEKICQELSQSTLRHCLQHVSRRWHRVCFRFIHRVARWKPSMDPSADQETLMRLQSGVNTLEFDLDDGEIGDSLLRMNSSALSFFASFSATKVMTILQKIEAWTRFHEQLAVTGQAQRLQKLGLLATQQALLYRKTTLSILLPHLLALRVLDLRGRLDIVPVFEILERCRALEELLIQGTSGQTPPVLVDRLRDGIEAAELLNGDVNRNNDDDDKQTTGAAKYHRLLVFDVQTVTVTEKLLIRIGLACRRLRVFKAIDLNRSNAIRASGQRVSKPIKESSLFHMLSRHCLELECVRITEGNSGENDYDHLLNELEPYFPEICKIKLDAGYWRAPREVVTSSFLKQITTLELILNHDSNLPAYFTRHPILDVYLRLMPNLEHLVAPGFRAGISVEYLWFEPTESAFEDDNYSPGNETEEEGPETADQSMNLKSRRSIDEHLRSNRRREMKTERRAMLTSRSHPCPTTKEEESFPLVWQCQKLRTFDAFLLSPMRGDVLCYFSYYLQLNRLFGLLTVLRIRVEDFHFGQNKMRPYMKVTPPPRPLLSLPSTMPSPPTSMTTTPDYRTRSSILSQVVNANSWNHQHSTLHVRPGQEQLFKPLTPRAEPERFNNHLKRLLGQLPLLEQATFLVQYLQGVPEAHDFEFLRKKDEYDPSTMSSSSSSSYAAATTLCPRLQSFHIRYQVSSVFISNFTEVVAGMQKIRPEVEFQIKKLDRIQFARS